MSQTKLHLNYECFQISKFWLFILTTPLLLTEKHRVIISTLDSNRYLLLNKSMIYRDVYQVHAVLFAFFRICITSYDTMMKSSNGNIFCCTGPLWRESTGDRRIRLTKASDAELRCFFYLRLNKCLSKQSRHRWFETPSCSLWRHYQRHVIHLKVRIECWNIMNKCHSSIY